MSAATANQSIKQWPGWLALLFVAVLLVALAAGRDRGVRTPVERANGIEQLLACPICDGESVYESRNRASNNIRNRVTVLVNQGQLTDDEIIADVVQTYGENILLVPRSSGSDTLVWALPVAAFVAGGAGLVLAFRRWKRASDIGGAPTDDDRALVAAALGDDATAAVPPAGGR